MEDTTMAKIAISLPDTLLAAIEQLRRKTGETRSEFLRRAARSAMDRELERQWDEEYEEAYRKFPETAQEIAVAEAGIQEVFAENPWEGDNARAER